MTLTLVDGGHKDYRWVDDLTKIVWLCPCGERVPVTKDVGYPTCRKCGRRAKEEK